jgi:hypothetical protein
VSDFLTRMKTAQRATDAKGNHRMNGVKARRGDCAHIKKAELAGGRCFVTAESVVS